VRVDYLHYRARRLGDRERRGLAASGRAPPGLASSGPADPEEPGRFAVVYNLLSIATTSGCACGALPGQHRSPVVDSLVAVWASANWFEREAFDLFGILFRGHPDLRRILTDYGFIGHPFRKDFPLIGNVEVRTTPTRSAWSTSR
jgi:NADH-quinone oxidoreductase subunit C